MYTALILFGFLASALAESTSAPYPPAIDERGKRSNICVENCSYLEAMPADYGHCVAACYTRGHRQFELPPTPTLWDTTYSPPATYSRKIKDQLETAPVAPVASHDLYSCALECLANYKSSPKADACFYQCRLEQMDVFLGPIVATREARGTCENYCVALGPFLYTACIPKCRNKSLKIADVREPAATTEREAYKECVDLCPIISGVGTYKTALCKISCNLGRMIDETPGLLD